jgi:hypothetical protein
VDSVVCLIAFSTKRYHVITNMVLKLQYALSALFIIHCHFHQGEASYVKTCSIFLCPHVFTVFYIYSLTWFFCLVLGLPNSLFSIFISEVLGGILLSSMCNTCPYN